MVRQPWTNLADTGERLNDGQFRWTPALAEQVREMIGDWNKSDKPMKKLGKTKRSIGRFAQDEVPFVVVVPSKTGKK